MEPCEEVSDGVGEDHAERGNHEVNPCLFRTLFRAGGYPASVTKTPGRVDR